MRKYDYSYDAAGRLLSAAFTQFTDGAFNLSAGIDYSVMMGNGQSPSSATMPTAIFYIWYNMA
ncbi:MAG: hypothetical protein IPI36_08025 [Chitinophagaceae bacterium]|nr:hypothetical protein [Chitinophagaceae bacterium]